MLVSKAYGEWRGTKCRNQCSGAVNFQLVVWCCFSAEMAAFGFSLYWSGYVFQPDCLLNRFLIDVYDRSKKNIPFFDGSAASGP